MNTLHGHRSSLSAHHAGTPTGGGARWWLWLHLASLDASLVAVAWQGWWARNAGVHLSWQRNVVLALSVWLIYLADRWADAIRALESDHQASRHHFYRRARAGTASLALALLSTLAVVTPWWLTYNEFGVGLAMLGLASVYFWTTHRHKGPSWTSLLPKEGAVGLLFALGSALFAWCRAGSNVPVAWWVAVGSFAMLCFLNCALITHWEMASRDLRDPGSLLNVFPGVVRRLPEGCAGLAMVTGGLCLWSGAFLPVTVSAGLLWGLDYCRPRLSADALRVLADMVLFTPLIFAAFGG